MVKIRRSTSSIMPMTFPFGLFKFSTKPCGGPVADARKNPIALAKTGLRRRL